MNYKVTVETGEIGTDANVMLCIYGDDDTIKHVALRTTSQGAEAKFEKDSRLEFDLKEIYVGKVSWTYRFDLEKFGFD